MLLLIFLFFVPFWGKINFVKFHKIQKILTTAARPVFVPCEWIFGNLDDILIYSCDLKQHERHVKSVLQRLYENHLEKPKNVGSVFPLCFFWVLFWRKINSGLTLRRTGLSLSGQFLQIINNSSSSWDSPTFTDVSLRKTTELLPPDPTHLLFENLLMDPWGRQCVWWVKGSFFNCCHSVNQILRKSSKWRLTHHLLV